MISREIEIINKLGLHARAAAKLVSTAAQFSAEVKLNKAGQSINAKSIMGVMMLAAGIGTEVSLRCEGEDEQAAHDALVALFEDKFGEGE